MVDSNWSLSNSSKPAKRKQLRGNISDCLISVQFAKYKDINAITADDVNVQIHLNKNSGKIFSLQNAEEGEKRKIKEIRFRVSKELIWL